MDIVVIIGLVGGFTIAHLCAISIALWLYWSVFRRSFVECSTSNAVYKKVYRTLRRGEDEMELQTRQTSTSVKQKQSKVSAAPLKMTDACTPNKPKRFSLVLSTSSTKSTGAIACFRMRKLLPYWTASFLQQVECQRTTPVLPTRSTCDHERPLRFL